MQVRAAQQVAQVGHHPVVAGFYEGVVAQRFDVVAQCRVHAVDQVQIGLQLSRRELLCVADPVDLAGKALGLQR